MAYDTGMAAVSTNDVIMAAQWNTLVNNIDFLHDTRETIYAVPLSATGMTVTGDFAAPQVNNLNNTTHTVFQVPIPDNYGTLVSAIIVILSTTSYTAEYDCNVDFGAIGEAYNANSGALTNQTKALVANTLNSIDISSLLSGLAGADYLGVRLSNSTGANAGNWQVLFLKLTFTRSDSTP